MAASPFLKICGLQTVAEARDALAAGATALGVLAGLTHRAEDEVSSDVARTILQAVPNGVETVLVTHLTDPVRIAALAEAVGARAIQVHGDMPPGGVRALRGMAGGRRLIKAVHVSAPGHAADATLERGRAYAGEVDAILLDSRTSERLGGTGRTHDWTISARVVAALAPLPVYLAGGLTPDNVAAAIGRVLPAGVDVNSGVEDAAGRKDPVRLRAFLAAARSALAG